MDDMVGANSSMGFKEYQSDIITKGVMKKKTLRFGDESAKHSAANFGNSSSGN